MKKITSILFLISMSITTNNTVFAQKKKDKNNEKTFENIIAYHNKTYKGVYKGSVTKVKSMKGKVEVPEGHGTFVGYVDGSGKTETVYSDQFRETLSLKGLGTKPSQFTVNADANTDFTLETSISMTRLDENSGGAMIRLNFDNSNIDYLECTLMEYKKETYDPTTASIAVKTVYNTAKTAFNNISVSGYIGGVRIEQKMKVFALDYSQFNKYKIVKAGSTIEIIVNDISQGIVNLSKNVGIASFSLDKDASHNVDYDFIQFDKTKYDEKDKFEYTGNWKSGVFDGDGELKYMGGIISGTFSDGDLNGTGKGEWSEYKYYGEMVNGVANGIGEIYAKNYTYKGQVKDWSANGTGVMTISDNSIPDGKIGKQLHSYPFFKGEFINGKLKGVGKMTYPNGDTLGGIWDGLLFTGTGKLTLQDGSVYEGSWKNGEKDGKGKLTYSDGYVLSGDFINDGFNGKGRIRMADGGTFEGDIVMGKPSGSGTASYPNGDKLTGSWNEFGFNGTGKRTYEAIPNEEGKFCFEEGQWKDGKLHGNGKKVYQFKIKPEDEWQTVGTYSGQFNNGQFQGKGVLSYYNGFADLVVDATWQNGQSINGKVTYTEWDDESKYMSYYTGELTGLGIANGSGTFKSSEGSVYVGQMKNGVPYGKGTLTLANGTKQTGEFIEGAYQKEFECKKAVIGTQTWMAENLSVTKFRNGDPIPEAKTWQEWVNAKEKGQPAFCYANNDPSNVSKYGVLYNWYAVNDPRGLAPKGWRVPNEKDYQQLKYGLQPEINKKDAEIEKLKNQGASGVTIQQLVNERDTQLRNSKWVNGIKMASVYLPGYKLKTTAGWNNYLEKKSNWNGNNKYGFNAAPSFERNIFGSFNDPAKDGASQDCNFWLSTSFSRNEAAAMKIDQIGDLFIKGRDKFMENTPGDDKGTGHPVRLIKE